jgi:hypothetical protein
VVSSVRRARRVGRSLSQASASARDDPDGSAGGHDGLREVVPLRRQLETAARVTPASDGDSGETDQLVFLALVLRAGAK